MYHSPDLSKEGVSYNSSYKDKCKVWLGGELCCCWGVI